MPLASDQTRHRKRLYALALTLTALLAGCRSGAFPQYADDYREYAYVADQGGNTISVLDVVHVRQQVLLTVAAHPVALAANPMRNEIYAASEGAGTGNGSLTFIDAEQNRVVGTTMLGRMPTAIAVAADGKALYVTNEGSNSVSVVDIQARKVAAVAGVGEQPGALAISPDNSTLVVANRQSGSVSLLELPSSANAGSAPVVRSTFAGCEGANSVVILPDASKAFIACSGGHQVMVLGLRTSAAAARRHSAIAAEQDRLLAMLDVGAAPVQLVLKPDGGEIFVTNRDANTVSEIVTSTNEVGGAALIGTRPISGVVSPDNAMLWVANEEADTIAVYSVDDGKLINTVHVGGGPGPMSFSADGHLLFAADTRSGDVSVLRTFSRNFHREPVYGTLFTLLPAGRTPSAIVDKAFRLKH